MAKMQNEENKEKCDTGKMTKKFGKGILGGIMVAVIIFVLFICSRYGAELLL